MRVGSSPDDHLQPGPDDCKRIKGRPELLGPVSCGRRSSHFLSREQSTKQRPSSTAVLGRRLLRANSSARRLAREDQRPRHERCEGPPRASSPSYTAADLTADGLSPCQADGVVHERACAAGARSDTGRFRRRGRSPPLSRGDDQGEGRDRLATSTTTSCPRSVNMNDALSRREGTAVPRGRDQRDLHVRRRVRGDSDLFEGCEVVGSGRRPSITPGRPCPDGTRWRRRGLV